MASRLLRGAAALATQALRARGPNGAAAVRSMASGGGVPTDDKQATGLEREIMVAARKGLDPYDLLPPDTERREDRYISDSLACELQFAPNDAQEFSESILHTERKEGLFFF
ncbi:Cytochrome c oxidase subunit 5B, mitochondrial [Tupaia chinensis]|uniref:Cytochrome c oxidase subunit 5B, mitochondrial n=1 Tax=Tupaia chinensis TaxID=246437 RepID=L8YBX7_TUPCH|nr:Cytochrome c oxidase subunit 5B, mitochondrial [Tupaia chinensis]